jgi:hypothetical protein
MHGDSERAAASAKGRLAVPRLFTVAAAAATVAAALSACGAASGSGPLWHPSGDVQCVPAVGHQVLTDGLEALQNRAMTTAVIDKVAFADPDGLRFIRAYVVPDSGSLYGVLYGYPPAGAAEFDLTGFHWNRRQDAAGARLPHDETMNLLLVFRMLAGAARGTAAGIDIWYHAGGSYEHVQPTTYYRFRTYTALVVLVNRRSC